MVTRFRKITRLTAGSSTAHCHMMTCISIPFASPARSVYYVNTKEGITLDAIRKTCAGLDVHQASIVACILTGELDKKPKAIIQTFGTTTKELLQLQDWLSEHKCSEIAMESTGVLWKPVWNILESTCQITLANPQRIKNVPGRKTDVKDAQWIAQLHRCGLIEPSVVPSRDIRELRDLTRYRKKLIQQVTSEKNRIHKILQDCNIKMTTYISDLFGVSGRALLGKLVDGEALDEQTIKGLVKTRLKRKVPQLVDALNGKVLKHHREMMKHHLEHIDFLEKQIGRLEQEIENKLQPYKEELNLIQSIPGFSKDSASAVLAEITPIAVDMFPTDAQMASWLGICPGNHESAGVKKKAKSNKGNKHAKAMLCQVVWANSKSNNRIGGHFRRIRKRRGEKKAVVATAHLLIRIVYAILRDRTPYSEQGNYYEQENKEKAVNHLVKQLKNLGYEIDLIETAV